MQRRPWTNESQLTARRLSMCCFTIKQVAEQMERHPKLVGQKLLWNKTPYEKLVAAVIEKPIISFTDYEKGGDLKMNRKWTEEEDKRARKMHAEGYNYVAIAKELDRSVRTISYWIKRPPYKAPDLDAEAKLLERMKELRAQNLSYAAIGRELGVDHEKVRRWLSDKFKKPAGGGGSITTQRLGKHVGFEAAIQKGAINAPDYAL